MLNCKSGFTLTEILVVVLMISVMLSMVFSVSYKSYKKYRYYYELTEIVSKLKNIRRESFLYSEEKVVYSKEGKIFIDGKPVAVEGCRLSTDRDILFTKTGSEGGVVTASCGEYTYKINIIPPYGEIVIE